MRRPAPRRSARSSASPAANRDTGWRINRVTALFDAARSTWRRQRAPRCAASGWRARRRCASRQVAEQDWVRASQQQFSPVQISSRLWIVPSWCEEPDPAAINLRLDPGLAFGTGSHPTTWQCLRWLEANLRARASRCWTMAAAAVCWRSLRRSWAPARWSAWTSTRERCRPAADNASGQRGRNRRALGPTLCRPGPYDVVVANILSNPLQAAGAPAGRAYPAGREQWCWLASWTSRRRLWLPTYCSVVRRAGRLGEGRLDLPRGRAKAISLASTLPCSPHHEHVHPLPPLRHRVPGDPAAAAGVQRPGALRALPGGVRRLLDPDLQAAGAEGWKTRRSPRHGSKQSIRRGASRARRAGR